MEDKTGYITTTYKLRLYCSNLKWLYETRELYNLVLAFYYEVLQKESGLFSQSNQKLLRQLELMTVGARGQDKRELAYPLPYKKIPLYFRRAAINDAVRLYKSYMSGKDKGCKPAQNFQAWPVFYKGMYKDFTQTQISLKLWNGDRWLWEQCQISPCGREFEDVKKLLSPMLKLDGKKAILHVPVVQEVENIGTVRERYPKEQEICAVYFPHNDCLAVLVFMDKDGGCKRSIFIRGGKQLAHKKKLLLNRIYKNRKSMGWEAGMSQREQIFKELNVTEVKALRESLPEGENRHLKDKIRALNDDCAHKISRQIINFCAERQCHILIVPNYKYGMDLNAIGWIPASGYDWLGRRIIQYLRYKAFGKGMVVASVSTKDTARTCYLCNEPVKRFNKNHKPGHNYYGGKNYICPNGHTGNANFNSAMNIGRKFLKSQGEIQG